MTNDGPRRGRLHVQTRQSLVSQIDEAVEQDAIGGVPSSKIRALKHQPACRLEGDEEDFSRHSVKRFPSGVVMLWRGQQLAFTLVSDPVWG